jgi:hypothetical protein
MRFQKFFEFNQKDLDPIKSFYIKDELNPKIWGDFKLDQDVRENLLTIARDFFETLDTECEVKDIALCGSLCNYNWSEKYSDYDLHIIIDYRDIDENVELVEKFCDYAKKQWNSNHDIKIKGYEVEVAIQDEKDLKTAISTGRMGGVFSLMKNKWTKKPEKVEFIPDEKTLERKATVLMDTIDELEEEVDEDKYTKFKEKIDRLWKKIKKYRQSGLEEEGEYSTGNLLFKLLRRNGYISKVMDLKKKSYDQQFEAKYFKFYVNDKLSEEEVKRHFEFDTTDVQNILTSVTDVSDSFDISVNFRTDRGFVDKIDDYDSLSCEISFFLNESHTPEVSRYDSRMIDCSEHIKIIDENLDLSYFEQLGYIIKILKREQVLNNTNHHPNVGRIGNSFYTIFITTEQKENPYRK